jgi:hypothetical protein
VAAAATAAAITAATAAAGAVALRNAQSESVPEAGVP